MLGMNNFIKNREPAAVAAFLLALMQGIYVVINEFGYSLTVGQWSAITAVLTLVAGFVVRGNVTSNATLAAMKPSTVPTTPPSASVTGLVAVVLLVSLGIIACTRAGKFDPSVPKGVTAACTSLDSGNPALGVLCLTAEEVTSIFSHVKATRAAMKTNPEFAAAHRTGDVCAAPVEPQP